MTMMSDMPDEYNYAELPEGLRDGMQRYVEDGHRYVRHLTVGGFLTACLENDLGGAINRADEKNLSLLPDIVQWMYWNLPGNCWGSIEKVQAWQGTGLFHTCSDVTFLSVCCSAKEVGETHRCGKCHDHATFECGECGMAYVS